MDKSATRESPYVGLVPFREEDVAFFFGRTSEVELVAANLRASPMTLLYGPSGVGKSSMLCAGVLNNLSQKARQNLKQKGTPEFAVALFDKWSENPLAGLTKSIHAA